MRKNKKGGADSYADEVRARHAAFLREQEGPFFESLEPLTDQFHEKLRAIGERALATLPEEPFAESVAFARSMDLDAIERELRESYERLRLKGHRATSETHPDLCADIDTLCRRGGIQPLSAHIITEDAPLVMVYRNAVMVHDDVLTVMNHEEVMGLVGHEIGHVLAGHVPKTIGYARTNEKKEYAADEISAHLTGKPRALMSALEKFKPLEAWQPRAERIIMNVLKGKYPPTEDRIARLQDIAEAMEAADYQPERDFAGWFEEYKRSKRIRGG